MPHVDKTPQSIKQKLVQTTFSHYFKIIVKNSRHKTTSFFALLPVWA